MKQLIFFYFLAIVTACSSSKKTGSSSEEWIPLFDGKSLTNWRASENPATFTVENGTIVVHGPRAHLFYEGPVMNHQFKNFELKARVMTTPGSNSGIFFHTAFLDNNWPS